MSFRMLILAGAFIPCGSIAALAQTDQMHMLHLAAANQLGVIEYCQSQGFVDAATVDAQKKIATTLPASPDTSGLDDAETTGKQGTLEVNGMKTTLASAATAKNTTVQAICGQIGNTVKMAANNMQSLPQVQSPQSMPNMPAMPNMPNMPNMPAMPSAPPHQ